MQNLPLRRKNKVLIQDRHLVRSEDGRRGSLRRAALSGGYGKPQWWRRGPQRIALHSSAFFSVFLLHIPLPPSPASSQVAHGTLCSSSLFLDYPSLAQCPGRPAASGHPTEEHGQQTRRWKRIISGHWLLWSHSGMLLRVDLDWSTMVPTDSIGAALHVFLPSLLPSFSSHKCFLPLAPRTGGVLPSTFRICILE